LIPEEEVTLKSIFGVSERFDDHPALTPHSTLFVSQFIHFLHLLEHLPVRTANVRSQVQISHGQENRRSSTPSRKSRKMVVFWKKSPTEWETSVLDASHSDMLNLKERYAVCWISSRLIFVEHALVDGASGVEEVEVV
jgi:hypothetical protein